MANKKRKITIDQYNRKRFGKPEVVRSHERKLNQISPEHIKSLENQAKNRNDHKCYYCGKTVEEKELLRVDQVLGEMEGEEREFLLDDLPQSDNPREQPFVHKSDLGYDVLNICKKHLEAE